MPVAAGQVHHFAMGSWLLFFAYAVSVTGSVVGFACARRSRRAGEGWSRIRWLAGAAASIGGVGVWLTHFVAMLGVDIPRTFIRYDATQTTVSALMSIIAVFAGLLVFGVRTPLSTRRLLLGGVVTGLGINLAHYIGAGAVRIQGTITYAAGLVGLSIVIAIIAATTTLLLTVLSDTPALKAVAGLVVGIAVIVMHYTGMAAIQVQLDPNATTPTGAKALTFLLPVIGLTVLVLAIPIYGIVMPSTWSDTDAPHHDDLPKPQIPQPPSIQHSTNSTSQVRGVARHTRQPTIPARLPQRR